MGGGGSGCALRIISSVARSSDALPEPPASEYDSTLPSASTTKRKRLIPCMPRRRASSGYFLNLLKWRSKSLCQVGMALLLDATLGAGAADFCAGAVLGGVSTTSSSAGFSCGGSGFFSGLGG
ncbi:hypothetical protein D3C76_1432360 [compost metagenome]